MIRQKIAIAIFTALLVLVPASSSAFFGFFGGGFSFGFHAGGGGWWHPGYWGYGPGYWGYPYHARYFGGPYYRYPVLVRPTVKAPETTEK